MADKMRVHILAKDLGVASKAILTKCRAEGVEIKNHMSTLSAGLEATIREWFSEGLHGTTIEEAARVDLASVRKTRRTRTKKKKTTKEKVAATTGAPEPGEAPVAGVAVAEAPPVVETQADQTAAVRRVGPSERVATEPAEKADGDFAQIVSPPPVAPTSPAPETETPPGEPKPAEPAPPETTPLAPAAEAPTPQVAEPPAPEERPRPVGPQNIPAPAQLQGPRVVRVERPEPLRPLPPRGGPFRLGGRPALQEPILPPGSRIPTGRGRGQPAPGTDEAKAKRGKNRVHPRRTGRGSDAGERLQEWRDRDLLERQERLRAASGRGIHARRAVERHPGGAAPIVPIRRGKVQLHEPIVLHEYCGATGLSMQQLSGKLISEHKVLPNRNTILDADLATLLAMEFGIEVEVTKAKSALDELREEFEGRERKNLQKRPPVVTFLGHVDHGKTSLLDAIREARVAQGEAGGITQHIGAYRVDHGDLSVTFLDTPGHEAFTALRARGANMTDVVVLVVAADDGVMPQTIEAINHARAAKAPIVVALNKIDLPNADLNRVFGQLAEHELTPQKWGGQTDVIETSATRGEGIHELIEHLATLSDLLELKADPDAPATGTVIEAQMEEGVGPNARVLVQEGTLRIGDIIVCGPAAGRVRSLRDDRGRRLKEVSPGTPVEVAGLNTVPDAGDRFYQVKELQRAKAIAEAARDERREAALTRLSKPKTLEDIFQAREAGEIPELNVILRADAQGSVDVLLQTLSNLPSDKVKLNILHAAVGSVSESDVVLAEASKAIIVGFHVSPDPAVKRLADSSGVEIRLYQVIYELTDDVRNALGGMLEPERKEEDRGRAEVRQVFRISKVGMAAGCHVTEGTIARSHHMRVIRDGRIIVPTADDAARKRHRSATSLHRFKDDVREVRAGLECGIRIENFEDVKVGDVIESYEVVEIARKL